MRIRSIKPEFWGHPVMAKLPAETQLMALALISWSDDFGYFEADLRAIRGAVMPYRDNLESIDRDCQTLVEVGFIEVRETAGRRVGKVVKFELHQRVEKPKPSKLKEYFESGSVDDSSTTNPRLVHDSSTTNPGRKGREGKGSRKGRDQEGSEQAALLPDDSRKTPPSEPKAPSLLAKLHARFEKSRDSKLYAEAVAGGLELELDAHPDEEPDWGRSAAVLAQWKRLWPDISEAELEERVGCMASEWLESPFWASLKDRDGKPKTPFPWGAFITSKQWGPIAKELFGADVERLGVAA